MTAAALSTLPAPELDAWEDDSKPLYLIDHGGELVELGRERDLACGLSPWVGSALCIGIRNGAWHASWDDVQAEGGSMFAALYELRQKLKAQIARGSVE